MDKSFSVASCYEFLDSNRIPYGPPNIHDGVFSLLWKLDVPFKIKAFGWRLFRSRLPIKDQLALRGIALSLDNSLCSFCGVCSENLNHLFFECGVVKKIWRDIAVSVGKGDSYFVECLAFYMVKGRKLGVVWLAITWAIWLVRNGVCFRNDPWNVDNTVWNIKLLVWKWSYCGKITHPKYSFYEFCKDPVFFLS
ncbi:uncharacterized protein LOC131642356 [Vicia villosa]|uniref:uncharacterized protein LOC131598225 n=1 Tax=Vicia villosa TaxID=3911 RepID=UPI00273AE3C6|nr:uncharacterized protein LOC131598225 [Vicia villosa]XP_058768598.1 uncharacterized protein LOC131642356 [Vicia villosa]